MNTRDYTEDEIITAITGSRGIVSNVADALGCAWMTADRWIKMFDSTKQAFNDEKERFIDHAESKAYEAVTNGDTGMIKFILNTIGKKRGYTEKHEIEQSGDINIIFKSIKKE